MSRTIDVSGTLVVVPDTGPDIQQLTATGTTQGAAAEINRDSAETVVFVTTAFGDNAVIVPSDSEIGDLLEIHYTQPNGILIFTQGTDTFTVNGNTSVSLGSGLFCLLRKLSSTTWGITD